MPLPTVGALQDLRHAIRMLRREPGYAVTAVLAIALGITATTTLFSITYGVLLKPLPWRDADRLVRLEERRGGRPGRIPWTLTNGTYHAWRDSPATLEAVGGWMSMPATFSDGGDAARIRLARLTPGMFDVLGVRAFAGRVFEERDAATRQSDAVLLSYGFWQRRFGGAADVVGRSIRLDYLPYTVIGVMPRDFAFPDRETEAWTPAYIAPVFSDDGKSISLQIFGALGRMRGGVTPEQVAAEGTARARSVRDPGAAALALFGSGGAPTITAAPALEVMIAEVRPAIRILVAAVLLLFATAVASVATVQLARVARRRREMTVRAALGASATRLARHWLTEIAVAGSAGGVLGIAAAQMIVAVLPSILPADFPRLSEVALDWRAALVSTAATLAAIAVCGLVPAMQIRRPDLVQGLGDDSLAPVGVSVRTPAARLRAAFMAAQIAVACVLLIGAGLLGRSLHALINVDRGYDPANLLTARVPLPSGTTFATGAATLEAIAERLRALPGVTIASFGNALPLVSAGSMSGFTTRVPREPSVTTKVQTLHRTVDPRYFATMRLRLIAGRLLSDSDTAAAQPVLVVNKSFADQYLGAEPIGRRLPLSLYRQAEWEVVGVVDDMMQGGLETAGFVRTADAAQPEMFSSYRQFPEMRPDSIFFIVRTADAAAHAPSLRAIVREEAPTFVVESVMTMDDRLMSSLSRPRAYALVLGGLSAFALAIALVGLFGVVSYGVTQRTREIGVRSALGARPIDVVALVVRSGMVIAGAGLIAGVTGAALLVGSLSKILYGVEPFDAATFVAVPAILAIAALAACAVPAHRAARLDPAAALRGTAGGAGGSGGSGVRP